MSGCPRRGDAVGHAFSALEPDEDRAFTAHLPHCAACRRALADATAVVANLGAAVPQVDPPPALRDRLLAAAEAEPGTPVRLALASPGTEARDDPAASAPAHPATPPRRRLVAAAGGLLAAVVLGIGLIVARGVLPTQATPPDTPAVALAQRADQVVDDARSRDPGLRSAILRDQAGDPAAVVLDPSDAAAPIRLVALDLPPAGGANDYVVWATGLPGNAPVAVAVVDPDDGLTRPLESVAPAGPGVPGPRGYAVSVEPSGPAPARPSTVVAVGLTVA
ncbi:hypothetical protein GCM10023200_43490 [Actinomycetospora chlora]|uniref:Anti-sigma factor n=1 Tax=Actinomycetospora chlora TaxID=663608 RepID=A0ABP9BY72_9PSEU